MVLSLPFLSLSLVISDSGLSFHIPFVCFASYSQVAFIDFFFDVLLVANPSDSFFFESCLFDGLTFDALPLLGLPADLFFASTLLGVLDLADADLFLVKLLDAFFVLVALACDSLLVLESSPPLFFRLSVIFFVCSFAPVGRSLGVAIDQMLVPGAPLAVSDSGLVLVVLVILVFLILLFDLVDPALVSLSLFSFAGFFLCFLFHSPLGFWFIVNWVAHAVIVLL